MTNNIDNNEGLMAIDKFYRPLTVKEEDMAIILITRLILLEPGTFQTHPDMGVGLVSKFRYSNEVQVDKLALRIKSQIEKYLPQYTLTNVQCDLDPDSKVIKIYITSDQINAMIPVDTNSGNIVGSLGDML